MMNARHLTTTSRNHSAVAQAAGRTSRTLSRCVLALALGTAAHAVLAMGNNDYKLSNQQNIGGNGFNVDPVSGDVYVGFNHAFSVYGAGLANATPRLTVQAPGASSPTSVVRMLNPTTKVMNYYMLTYWFSGTIYQYDDNGKDVTPTAANGGPLIVGDPTLNNSGGWSMVADANGNLVVGTKNSKSAQAPALAILRPDNTQTFIPGSKGAYVIQPAVDPQGRIYYANRYGAVHVYSPSDLTNAIKTIGPVNPAQNYVDGVAVDQRGYIYVAEHASGSGYWQVQKYDSNFNFVKTVISSADGQNAVGMRFDGNNDDWMPIAVDPSGSFIYLQQNSKTIFAFQQTFGAPPAPTLTASGAVSPPHMTASWPVPASPITSYSLQISKDQTNWTTITVPGTATSRVLTTSDFAALAPGGTYYLRISATDVDGTSPFSPTFTATLQQAPSTTSVSANPASVGVNTPTTISVTVAAQNAADGSPTGTVNVSDGSASCTATLSQGSGSCALTPTSMGSKTVTASYQGDTSFTTSTGNTTLTVNTLIGSSVTVASSANPSSAGSPVTFSVNIATAAAKLASSKAAAVPTGTVSFTDNGAPLGSVNAQNGVASFSTSALTVGSHTIEATYSGDGNYSGSSGTVVQQIQNAVVVPPGGQVNGVPTLSTWGLMLLGSLLALFGIRRTRKG